MTFLMLISYYSTKKIINDFVIWRNENLQDNVEYFQFNVNLINLNKLKTHFFVKIGYRVADAALDFEIKKNI